MTVPEDDASGFPIDTRVMALEPVVPEVYILRSKIGNRKVDALSMLTDCYAEFDEFSDIPTLIVGSVGIVHWDRYYSLLHV